MTTQVAQRVWVGGEGRCERTDLERSMCAHCRGNEADPDVTFGPWGGVMPNRGREAGSVSEINDHTPPPQHDPDMALLDYLKGRIDPRVAGASPEVDEPDE